MEHSDIFGGSTAARRIHCPGSYQLEQQVPKEEASEFAERGTALHEAMEYYLLEFDSKPLESLLGMSFNGYTITQELIDTKLRPAHTAFLEIIKAAGGKMDYLVEVTASLDSVIPGAFGTVDVVGLGADGRLWVVDWKFGDGVPVSPENNYQMAFYAAAALYDEDPELVDMFGADEKAYDVVMAIVQPRAHYPDERDWHMWETDTEWVESFLDIAVAAYEKLEAPEPPLSTGDHCRFCRAQHMCPLQQSGVQQVLDTKVPVQNMDPVTIATWLERVEEFESFAKALQKHAHAEAERGVKIPGWKCVPKRGARVYTDLEAAAAGIRKKLKVADAFEKKLISPAQAEKKLGKKEYERLVAPHVTMHSSGTTLARDSDPRPDVSDPSKSLANKLQATLAQGQQAES